MYNCECGKKGKHSHDGKPHKMSNIIKGVYEMSGENYLDPNNKTMAEGFWSAGQPGHKRGGIGY